MVLIAAVDGLLTLRLAALWNDSRIVIFFLYFIFIIEISASFLSAASGFYNASPKAINIDHFPLPGCFYFLSDKALGVFYVFNVTLTAVRLFATSSQVLLTLTKLVKFLKNASDPEETLLERVSHIRNFAPVMYTFYRDGTLFSIPILALVSLVLAAGRMNIYTNPLDYFFWPSWLTLAYYLVGTRLILNLRKADCKLTESIVSLQMRSALVFHQGQHDEEQTIE